MFTLKQIILLAIAGVAVALPHSGDDDGPRGSWPSRHGGNRDGNGKWIKTPTDSAPVTTITIYPGGDDFTGGDDSDNTPPTGGSTTPAPSTGSGSSTGYMAVVNKFRKAGGLAELTESSKLVGNAQSTSNAQKGDGSMKHILNSGSMAQVLAPGDASDFEHVYLGGWLCEMPNLPGLSGLCGAASKGWNHDGQTGHAEILSSTKYTSIGCALGNGIWCCDLA